MLRSRVPPSKSLDVAPAHRRWTVMSHRPSAGVCGMQDRQLESRAKPCNSCCGNDGRVASRVRLPGASPARQKYLLLQTESPQRGERAIRANSRHAPAQEPEPAPRPRQRRPTYFTLGAACRAWRFGCRDGIVPKLFRPAFRGFEPSNSSRWPPISASMCSRNRRTRLVRRRSGW